MTTTSHLTCILYLVVWTTLYQPLAKGTKHVDFHSSSYYPPTHRHLRPNKTFALARGGWRSRKHVAAALKINEQKAGLQRVRSADQPRGTRAQETPNPYCR
ncbi:hypothetical protein B0J17DRAFT_112931 [Rhizoctonia solani]|nr:hypothetical protein B0J17DRAFT_112931 [Rhizoctonia solani]